MLAIFYMTDEMLEFVMKYMDKTWEEVKVSQQNAQNVAENHVVIGNLSNG